MSFEIKMLEQFKEIDPVTQLRLGDVTMFNKIQEAAQRANYIILDNYASFQATMPNREEPVTYYVAITHDKDIYYTSSEICYTDIKNNMNALKQMDSNLVPIIKFVAIPNKKNSNNPVLKAVIEGAYPSMQEALDALKVLLDKAIGWQSV